MNVCRDFIERSHISELFLLRVLLDSLNKNGLPIEFSEINSFPQKSDLYTFVRKILTFPSKRPRTTIQLKDLLNLAIPTEIIDKCLNEVFAGSISDPSVRKELLFTLLIREFDPTYPYSSNLQRYLTAFT